MIRKLSALAAVALLSSVAAADITLTANLTHDQEPGAGPETTSTGGARPLSFGTATFILKDDFSSMTMSATINNIDFTGLQTADTFDNLAKAILDAIKGHAFHDDAQVARLLVERAAGERERITVVVRRLANSLLAAPFHPGQGA